MPHYRPNDNSVRAAQIATWCTVQAASRIGGVPKTVIRAMIADGAITWRQLPGPDSQLEVRRDQIAAAIELYNRPATKQPEFATAG